MKRKYKAKVSRSSYAIFRTPKGSKQSLQNDVRPGARVPSSWEDKIFSRYKEPFVYLNRLIQKNLPDEVIHRKMLQRFKIDVINCYWRFNLQYLKSRMVK